MAKGRSMDRLAHRVASVMSVRPARRRALMARLRRAAMILGPDRVLTPSWLNLAAQPRAAHQDFAPADTRNSPSATSPPSASQPSTNGYPGTYETRASSQERSLLPK